MKTDVHTAVRRTQQTKSALLMDLTVDQSVMVVVWSHLYYKVFTRPRMLNVGDSHEIKAAIDSVIRGLI
jgi:hypothetical protein